ncbi:hypothetical protein B0H14DRAFT_2693390, partial [Mycena olivaceomarginata]
MDPITPIESGLRINSLMPDSTQIIIQDSPGHCSPLPPRSAPCSSFGGILLASLKTARCVGKIFVDLSGLKPSDSL